MLSGLMAEYAIEKANFKKLLIGSRMIQISYGETFNLLFSKEFSDKELKEIQMVFILDAPYWFGSIEEWKARIGEPKDVAIGEIEDCLFSLFLVKVLLMLSPGITSSEALGIQFNIITSS